MNKTLAVILKVALGVLVAVGLIYGGLVNSSLEGTFHPKIAKQKYYCIVYNTKGHLPNIPCVRIYEDYVDISYRVWRYRDRYEVILEGYNK